MDIRLPGTMMVNSIILLAFASIGQAAVLNKRSTTISTSTTSAQYFQISPESFQGNVHD